MPVYEYYCPKCATKFEELRPLSRADDAARCPAGHAGANRTLSMFAAVTKNAAGGYEPMSSGGGGGCGCGRGGGGCGCGGGGGGGHGHPH